MFVWLVEHNEPGRFCYIAVTGQNVDLVLCSEQRGQVELLDSIVNISLKGSGRF